MFACLLAAVLGACSPVDGGLVCTASFAFIPAIAIDSNGLPVEGLTVSDTVLRTGQGFDVPQEVYLNSPGAIVVFSDNYLATVRPSGDSVRVTGITGTKGFSAMWQFGSDGCHVRKLAGPDTVVVR